MIYYIPDKHGNPKAVSREEYYEFELKWAGLRGSLDDPWIYGRDELNGVTVSTVMLMIDHDFMHDLDTPNPLPLVFETMIFGDEQFQYYQERYRTQEDALKGHKKAVSLVRRSQLGLKVVNE